MPIRSNPLAVQQLLGDPDAEIMLPLTMASEMVDVLLANSLLGSVILRQIEMYLACHIYVQAHPDVVRESYDNASFQYMVPTSGKGLCATKWGQMAAALDITGTLQNMEKGQVRITVI